ncbi:hypothetical protein [Nocardiopsis sp. CNR-923]|uniref:hypothetical protein n=1 Tax=Nocardiopsis sp. CNR-923 TaxID=1904965 RepID=UPI00096A78D1|nr:hypothetical protein [Nocardiopsis sp. CNR-923]
MHHPNGRHRKRHRTLAGQLWALATTALAAALTLVFVPSTPTRAGIGPAPRRRELPTGSPKEPQPLPKTPAPSPTDPDETGGALVRPYMRPRPQPRAVTIPRPRVPVGDLLAPKPPPQRQGEFDELASLIRVYLATNTPSIS